MLHDHQLLHLRYHDFFNLFPISVRSRIMNESETRTCKAGSVIFRRGEEGPWMGAILSGRVRIALRAPDNREMFLTMFERGEIFGERSLLDQSPRGGDAIAEEETTFIVLKREEMIPLLHQYPESMFSIVQMLCNRLVRYTDTMALYGLQNLPARLASYILYLARIYGKEVDGQVVFTPGLSQSDIGQKLGSSRESVNRQLKQFVEQGLVSQRGDEIVILDRSKLEALCT